MWPYVDVSFTDIVVLGKCLLTPTLIPFHRSSEEIADPGPISFFAHGCLERWESPFRLLGPRRI